MLTMKKICIILPFFIVALLCGALFGVFRFSSVETGKPAVAYIYRDGSIVRTVLLSGTHPYPQELSDWIAHNNKKLYHVTPVVYVPKIRLFFPGQDRSFDFLTDAVVEGTYIRGASEKDKQFTNWLLSRPGTKYDPAKHTFIIDTLMQSQ